MKKVPTVEVTDDLETILICAVRYACGRNTYMPGLVQDYIMCTFGGKLSTNTLTIIERDINEQNELMRRIGSNHGSKELYEHDLMLKLRDWCKAELEKKAGE